MTKILNRVYKIEGLIKKVEERFAKAGLDRNQAKEITNQLLYAEQRGISSHGLVRIKWIMEQVSEYSKPNADLLIENGVTELYDANGVLGYLALNDIAERQGEAIDKSIKYIGIRNTYPTGALSYFAEKLAAKGWIVLMSSTSPRRVGLHGDKSGIVGTNPWTFALPINTKLGGYVVVDVSLSELTHGQCLNAATTGQSLPTYAASQPGGAPINHPEDLWKDGNWNAVLHPIGREKGFKTFGVMWSLHTLGSRMLNLNGENEHGTFMLLMSPSMWEPVISASDITFGLKEEIQLLQESNVAHVPGEGRMSRFLQQQDEIILAREIVELIEG
jgi:LDH2 family malate/lactate/ureidoglycolate dehydrogenase